MRQLGWVSLSKIWTVELRFLASLVFFVLASPAQVMSASLCEVQFESSYGPHEADQVVIDQLEMDLAEVESNTINSVEERNPSISRVNSDSHLSSFSNNDEALQLINLKMSDLPRLRDELIKVINSPTVPNRIKRVIYRGLSEPELKAIEFTDELKIALGKQSTRGFVLIRRAGIQVQEPWGDWRLPCQQIQRLFGTFWGRLFPQATKKISAPEPKGYSEIQHERKVRERTLLVVPDIPSDAQEHDLNLIQRLKTSVHELAHLRFESFIHVNRSMLLKKIPRHLLWEEPNPRQPGKMNLVFNRDFYSFLTERFAFEQAAAFERSMLRTRPTLIANARALASERRALRFEANALSGFIIKAYDVRDPEVRRLKSYLVSEIFLGVPWKTR
jgi:hypothetical protein